jgi:outer membrane receptor protein involved in Fe transport
LRAGGVAWGGPLLAADPELLMVRLAVHRQVSDGFRRNETLRADTNARDESAMRLRLAWNPTPDWRWDGALLRAEAKNGFDEFALDNNGRRTFANRPGKDRQKSWAGSVRGTYTGWTAARLTTVTGGAATDSVYSYDDDWTAASYDGFSDLRRERNVFTQELRLDSAAARRSSGGIGRWTVGAFFSRTVEASVYTNEDPGNVRGLRTDYDGRQTAAFGQAGFELGAHTRLVTGLRVERSEAAGRGERTRYRKARGTFDPPANFAPGFDDVLVGGKLTLEQELGGGRMAFASVTRGYKSGGVNIDARISPPADPLTYATEDLWNREVGVRGHAFGQRLTGEVTGFLLQRRGTQVRDSAGFGGNYRFFTANGQDAETYGLEAAATCTLTKAWSLDGSYARMHSLLDRFTLTNGSAGGGRRLANTPRHGSTLGLSYRGGNGFFGRVERVQRAAQYDSNNHDESRRAFAVVNASVGFAWEGWTATVWARNLSDEVYDKRVFFFGNEDPDYVPARYESRADPRQIGATVSYRF